ncbi:MAG TPA: hypothetical protein EYH58_02920, partial [Aquifex aeolicus]|nr:hypothetical protein [Aquifex aeolicus]
MAKYALQLRIVSGSEVQKQKPLSFRNMEAITLELKDILDPASNLKTQELRAIEILFFVESEQVYKQIKEVLAIRLSKDIRAVVQRLGSIEKLKYLHPQDTKSFMRALYVELMMGYYLGRLHILRQAGEEKEFSSLVGSFEIPFEESIRFMRSLVPMRREEYDRLSQELKFRAFTIARVFSLDVINKIKERYVRALEKGETISDIMQFLDETLEKIGISEKNPYWLEVHARNNFLSAYNAGRWAQIAKAKTVKYLVYNAILDERTTKLCKSLDGVVRPKDDPFWDRFMPPNHHNCRSLATVVKNEFAYLKKIKSTSRKKIESFEKLIEEDKRLRREFQFRASPVKSLTGIPLSVFERAKEYRLVEEFLRFNVKTKLWDKV